MVSHREVKRARLTSQEAVTGCERHRWAGEGEGWLGLQAGVGEGGLGAGAGQSGMSRRVCDPQQLCVFVCMRAIFLGELEDSEHQGGWSQTGIVIPWWGLCSSGLCCLGVQLSPCRAASRCPVWRLWGRTGGSTPFHFPNDDQDLCFSLAPLAHSSSIESLVMPPHTCILQAPWGKDPFDCGLPIPLGT